MSGTLTRVVVYGATILPIIGTDLQLLERVQDIELRDGDPGNRHDPLL